MVAVTVEALHKRFGTTHVLKGVDLHVPDGQFAVLVGPSGCGKSTLLRLLSGLEIASEGMIRFGQRDVTKLQPRERDIAMVFQSYALYPHLTVFENLAFGLRLRREAKTTIETRVREVANMLGLDTLLDRRPKALSGGQRQRVAMGRAIVRRPQVFLFDEPLSNLDAALRAQVRVEIRRRHEALQTTSVYVTHDQVEAMTLADTMFVLNAGRVEQSGTPADVYRHPATKFVAGFLGSPTMNFLRATLRLQGDAWEAVVARPGGSALCIPLGNFPSGKLTANRLVDLGIRPHDMTLAPDPGIADLSLNAGLVELLGPEVQVHTSVADTIFTLCMEADLGVARGDRLHLDIDSLHVFDAESGESLR